MIFVDTVGESISTANYLQKQLLATLQSIAKEIIKTFYADLHLNKKIKIPEDFMNENTKIFICIVVVIINVYISDIKYVNQ